MVTALLQQIRLGVRRSPSLHAALDSLGVLAAGKRLQERLLLRRSYADVTLMGQRLRIAISSRREISRIEQFNEHEFVKRMLDSLRSGDVIWDIGANIGLIGLLLARRAAELGATIHAFEPEPRNYSQLVRNIELNGFGDVITPHEVALSDTNGTATLYVGGEAGEGTHSMLASEVESRSSIAVRVETGSAVVSRQGRAPSVLKIDVEGAEASVLRGLESELEGKRIRDIFIEVHSMKYLSGESNAPVIRRLLAARAYRLDWSSQRDAEIHDHFSNRMS